MADDTLNRIDAETGRDAPPGDIPERVRRRYLAEARPGSAVAYFTDAATTRPAFRDEGRRLSTDRNDPHVVGDLLAIAAHRGWDTIQVRGETRFRREVWRQAQALGLEVRGYRPTERDRQDLARQADRPRPAGPQPAPASPPRDGNARTRMRVVEAVVEARVRDPEARTRILAAARARIAGWLERGATTDPHRRRGRGPDR